MCHLSSFRCDSYTLPSRILQLKPTCNLLWINIKGLIIISAWTPDVYWFWKPLAAVKRLINSKSQIWARHDSFTEYYMPYNFSTPGYKAMTTCTRYYIILFCDQRKLNSFHYLSAGNEKDILKNNSNVNRIFKSSVCRVKTTTRHDQNVWLKNRFLLVIWVPCRLWTKFWVYMISYFITSTFFSVTVFPLWSEPQKWSYLAIFVAFLVNLNFCNIECILSYVSLWSPLKTSKEEILYKKNICSS